MAYQLYRNCSVGATLQDAVEELLLEEKITTELAQKVLRQFDESVSQILKQRSKAQITFSAQKLETYRFCDAVWTLVLKDVEFREQSEFGFFSRVKIVACEAKY